MQAFQHTVYPSDDVVVSGVFNGGAFIRARGYISLLKPVILMAFAVRGP